MNTRVSQNKLFHFQRFVFLLIEDDLLKPSANGRQKTLNKCETQNEIVFHIRLRHPETINNVSLNSVSRIRQTGVANVK